MLGKGGAYDVRLGYDGVDYEEFAGRIIGRYIAHGFFEEESGGDDEIESLIGEGGQVGDIVCLGGGLQVLVVCLRQLVVLGKTHDSLPGALVEGFIVNAAYVGHKADLELRKGRCRHHSQY